MGPPSSFRMGDIPQLRRGRTSSTAQRKRERGEEEGIMKDPEGEDNHEDIDVNHE